MSVALVTGAARPRGIGRATAAAARASDGHDVACLDIARPYDEAPDHAVASADDLDGIVAEIAAIGRSAIAVRADVSDEDAVEQAVAGAAEALGTITPWPTSPGGVDPVRGRSAGVRAGGRVSSGARRERHRDLARIEGGASRMVAAGVGGRICNVSSQAGKRGFAMLGAYCAAKAAVILLTQTMAMELGPVGISVNAVCPGTVDTDLTNPNGAMEELFGEALLREIPLGRFQSAEEIAATIAWLLSEEAAALTGEAVNASAGQTMV